MSGTATIKSRRVVDLLASLVDRSLVVYDRQPDGSSRYRLLETTSQYAQEKLKASGKETAVHGRHRDYFLQLVAEADSQLGGPEQRQALDRLEREHDNLRAVLKWSAEGKARLRLTGLLWRFWMIRGHLSEGREWLESALAAAGTSEFGPERVRALDGAGVLAEIQGEYAAARSRHEEALAIGRKLGDRQGIANSLNHLGEVACLQGDYETARSLREECLTIRRELGDRHYVAWALSSLGDVVCGSGDYKNAQTLYQESLTILQDLGDQRSIAGDLQGLGLVSYNQGDYSEANSLYEESITILREIEDKQGIALSLYRLGLIAYQRGDYPLARRRHKESLTVQGELGDRRGIAESLQAFAGLNAREDKTELAARLWGAAEKLRNEINAPLALIVQEEHDCIIAQVRDSLGEAAFSASWEEGRAMTLEEAIKYALQDKDAGKSEP